MIFFYEQLVLIDTIVVWRCIKIWKNRWVFTVIPVVSLVGTVCETKFIDH